MKNYHYLLLLIALILISGILFLNQQQGIFGKSDAAFSVRDTSKVHQFEICHGNNQLLSLNRANGSWLINDSLPASPVAVDNFLFVMNRVRIKGIYTENIMKDESDGLRISVMEGRRKRIFQLWFVNNMELIGREGSSRVFYSEVFGFPDLRIANVAVDDPFHWRDRMVFSFRPEEIEVIEIHYPASPNKDFALIKSGEIIQLYNPLSDAFIPEDQIKPERLRMFATYFMDVFFDEIVYDEKKTDSILDSSPEMRIKLEDVNGRISTLEIWFIRKNEIRDERYVYLRKDNSRELLITKQILMDLWRKELDDFLF